MARPLIALLYEHGRFVATDTARTSAALVMYCVGLPAFAAVGILTRTFYALGDTRAPVRASFVSVGLNLGLNLMLIGPLRGLGLGHAGAQLATREPLSRTAPSRAALRYEAGCSRPAHADSQARVGCRRPGQRRVLLEVLLPATRGSAGLARLVTVALALGFAVAGYGCMRCCVGRAPRVRRLSSDMRRRLRGASVTSWTYGRKSELRRTVKLK